MSPSREQNKTTNDAETRLLNSALTLFSEKGYEGTSIREIIEGAGVTRPVLYYYFENKEDLFRRLIEMKLRSYTDLLEDGTRDFFESLGQLKAIMRKTFELAEQNAETVRLILQVFFSPPQYGPKLDKSSLGPRRFRVIEEIMREGLERGELAGGDPQSLTLVFLGIMDMHVMAKSERPGTRLTPALADGLVDLFFYGACWKENPPTNLVSPYKYV